MHTHTHTHTHTWFWMLISKYWFSVWIICSSKCSILRNYPSATTYIIFLLFVLPVEGRRYVNGVGVPSFHLSVFPSVFLSSFICKEETKTLTLPATYLDFNTLVNFAVYEPLNFSIINVWKLQYLKNWKIRRFCNSGRDTTNLIAILSCSAWVFLSRSTFNFVVFFAGPVSFSVISLSYLVEHIVGWVNQICLFLIICNKGPNQFISNFNFLF